jgi:2-polyprenyl-6-methoxyphenol hydroxylase-like FAD-dependent oxidoreductase
MTQTGLTSHQGKALIIGAGMAGLLAARVLSEHYEEVQVVERDILPEHPEYRAGTPQSLHLHRVVRRGRTVLEALFPNLIPELLERGAASTANKGLLIVNQFGQFTISDPTEYTSSSRALLEWTIRQRVQALPNVHFANGLEVTGLQTNPEQRRITGVHFRQRGQQETTAFLDADLVVDTSGRTTKLAHWLEELGYAVPEPERLKSLLGYSTRYYRITSQQFTQKQQGILIHGYPEKNIRAGYSLLIENNLSQVVLFAAGGYYASTDDNGFEQQLRELLSPALADFLQEHAEPVNSTRGYRIETCFRYHYEQAERWPSGLLVMGDSLCNLDPIYGHGMTVAALEAEALARSLKEQQMRSHPDFERRTLTSFQEAIEPAWWLQAIADLRWAKVTYTGQNAPEKVPLLHRYLDLYTEEATKRMEQFIATSNPNDPPPQIDLFSPQPSIVSLAMVVNELVLSPKVVFNPTTYRLLLEIEAAQEAPHLLQQMTDEYHLPLDEILDKLLPTFSLSFLQPRAKPTTEHEPEATLS